MVADWLDGPPADDDWLDQDDRYVGVVEAQMRADQAANEAAIMEARETALVTVIKPDIELPSDYQKASQLFEAAWLRLSPRQQMFLSLLRQKRFNISATVRTLRDTDESVAKTTVQNWKLGDDFGFVLRVMESTAAGDVVRKERLLLRADEIADEALEPKPILHKGLPTGFYENHPDTALRANEQLMKATGVLRDAQQSTRVTVRLVNLAGPEATVIEGEAEVVE